MLLGGLRHLSPHKAFDEHVDSPVVDDGSARDRVGDERERPERVLLCLHHAILQPILEQRYQGRHTAGHGHRPLRIISTLRRHLAHRNARPLPYLLRVVCEELHELLRHLYAQLCRLERDVGECGGGIQVAHPCRRLELLHELRDGACACEGAAVVRVLRELLAKVTRLLVCVDAVTRGEDAHEARGNRQLIRLVLDHERQERR